MGNEPELGKQSPGKTYKNIRNALENKTKSQDELSWRQQPSDIPSQVDSGSRSVEDSQPGIADKLKKATEQKISRIWTEAHSDQLKARMHSGYEHAKIVADKTAEVLREAAKPGVADDAQEGHLIESAALSNGESAPSQAHNTASKDIPLPPKKTSTTKSGKRSLGVVNGILAVLLLILVVVTVLSFKTLLAPIDSYNSAGYDKSRNSGFASATSENTTEGKAAQPKINSISVMSLGGGNGDHPELAGKLLDGNPNSFWKSRFFKDSSYPDKAIFLVVKLTEPAPISTISLTSPAQGGTVQLLDPKSPDDTTGDILAKATFAPTFDLKLHEKLVTDHFTLKIPELPKDKDGRNRAWLGTVSVK